MKTVKQTSTIQHENREYWWRFDNCSAVTSDGEDEQENAFLSYENATAATSLQGIRKELDRSLEDLQKKRPPISESSLSP